ncbi:hypothetical protein [Calothrix sp. NIES-3974]|uniref:hypothetical protein n=1 Tax=Calothrix sp. NIES-3974 TaxID=2005462 RepID=UPI000B5E642B|nr:hypothetical protein [Calothrix sp. NIES-3974]BAZ07093.1 hypothetical protein NIES3974_37560 [Calothrix sp. NIES-3974]
MTENFFTNEDSHPVQLTSADIILRQQLEASICRYFFESCDRILQELLSRCRWYMTSTASAVTLVIECPDEISNWQILRKLPSMAKLLQEMSISGKIRIYPPTGEGMPFEMRVDELGIYRQE